MEFFPLSQRVAEEHPKYVIGIVDNYGSVRARFLTSFQDAVNTTHEGTFGPQGNKWRYYEDDGNVVWSNQAPTKEEQLAVDDWLSKRGIIPNAHVNFFGEKYAGLSKKAQTLLDDYIVPRTNPTQMGGESVTPDKAKIKATESDTTSINNPSEVRTKPEGANGQTTLQVDGRPGFLEIPGRGDTVRMASEFDRDYSTMGDTQTSTCPNSTTQPLSSQTGYMNVPRGSPTDLEGPPIMLGKKKKKEAQRAETVAPSQKLPLETLIKSDDEFDTDSNRVLPKFPALRPAIEMEDGKVFYVPSAKMHSQVIDAIAGINTNYPGKLPPELERKYDEVADHAKSLGFYEPSKNIYFIRSGVKKVLGSIQRVEVQLPPQVSYDMLWEFLEKHYPLKFLIEPISEGAAIYTDRSGIDKLQLLATKFWEIEGPARLERQGQKDTSFWLTQEGQLTTVNDNEGIQKGYVFVFVDLEGKEIIAEGPLNNAQWNVLLDKAIDSDFLLIVKSGDEQRIIYDPSQSE